MLITLNCMIKVIYNPKIRLIDKRNSKEYRFEYLVDELMYDDEIFEEKNQQLTLFLV